MDAASFYTGIVADIYTVLRSTSFDPKPYAAFVRDHGEPGLELGCGTGEPLLDLVAAGLDVDGVDSSPDMTDICADAARRRGLRTQIFTQRMEALALPRTYRSIYLAGPTFTLLPDDEHASAALASIRKHLQPGGAVLVPLWVPPPTPADALGVTRRSRSADGAEVRFTPMTERYDTGARVRRTACRYERDGPDGLEITDREWVIHWFTAAQFSSLAERAGFQASLVGEHAPDAAEFTMVLQG